MKTRLTVHLPSELVKRLRHRCVEMELSLSVAVEGAVRDWMNVPRSGGVWVLPDDPNPRDLPSPSIGLETIKRNRVGKVKREVAGKYPDADFDRLQKGVYGKRKVKS